MASLVPGYEYDIFVSYRQKDNKHLASGTSGEGWVSEFVRNLKEELDATFKEDISIYFDANPHDGLGDTHHVDKSLSGKLKCLILIPIISRTYCDPDSFAWQQEFLVFRDLARQDKFGLEIRLANRNVTSRILPIQIHDLSLADQQLFERENGGPLRAIQFVFKSQGVNRPLSPLDGRNENSNKTLYRDQINKTANAVEEILTAMSAGPQHEDMGTSRKREESKPYVSELKHIWPEVKRRSLLQAGFAYAVIALAVRQTAALLVTGGLIPPQVLSISTWLLALFFPVAMVLAWFYELSPDGFTRVSQDAQDTNPYGPSKRKPLTGSLILLAFLLIATIVLPLVIDPVPAPSEPSEPSGIRTIAVAPFENRTGSSNDKYLATSLTDEVITRLTVLTNLRVVKARSYNPDSIEAKIKGVTAILTGSVQRIGDTVRVNAQLIEVPEGDHIWAQTFTRRSKDMVVIQMDVAKRIGEVLKVKISEVDKARLEHRPTLNSTAYDYYLKGRSNYQEYRKDKNLLAIENYKNALLLDEKYANAWAGLADAYSQMNTLYGMEPAWIDSGLYAAKKAVWLDSTSSDAYKSLANAYALRGRYDTSIVLLKRALHFNPNHLSAMGNLGTDYMIMNNLPEALRWEKKAAALDPDNWIPYHIVGYAYRWILDLHQSEQWLRKSIEIDPSHEQNYEALAYCLVSQRREEEALALVPRVLALDSSSTRILEIAGVISHFCGDKKNAKKYYQASIRRNESYRSDPQTVSPIGLGQLLLEEGKGLDAEIYLSRAFEINLREYNSGSLDDDPPFNIAGIYAIRGQRQQSLEWLKKAIERNWIDIALVESGPWFAKYRHEPDFMALTGQVRERLDRMREEAGALNP